MRRVSRRAWGALAVFGSLLAIGSFLAGGAAAQTPEDDLEQAVQDLAAAWNEGDVEVFVATFTDRGLEDQFGFTSREEAIAALPEIMEAEGQITSVTVSDIFVTSGNATATVEIAFEAGFSFTEKWHFFFLEGSWRVDKADRIIPDIPAGVQPVPVQLQEYAFVFNEQQASQGNIAFQTDNVGEEDHELVLLRIDTEQELLNVVGDIAEGEGPEDLPAYAEFITFGGPYAPGERDNILTPAPLSDGRYAMLCFLPAPDGTPHALLGMASDFTVGDEADGGAAPISPPSTGDGGLAGVDEPAYRYALLAAGLLLLFAGATGFARGKAKAGS